MVSPSVTVTPEQGKKLFIQPGGIGLSTLISGKTGMLFTCKDDFTKYSSKKLSYSAYFRVFPAAPVAAYATMEERDSPSYWEKVAMKPGRKFDKFRDLITREAFDRDRIEWDTVTIIQSGKLPRGMRYMVDWRYIGGIPPMANGRMKATSYRRFLRPVPQSQCGSVCWFHMIRQSYSYSRPVQLGEAARIPELGYVPYCDGSMSNYGTIKNNDVCNMGLSQMRFYGFERSMTCAPANTNTVQTWEKYVDDASFGINSHGQKFERPFITDTGGKKYSIDTVSKIPDMTDYEGQGGNNEVPSDDVDFVDGNPDESGSFDNIKNTGATTSTACFYYLPFSSNNVDFYFNQFVDEKYRLKNGDKTIQPYMCNYNSILMCNNQEEVKKLLGFGTKTYPRTCKDSNGVKPVLLKYNVPSMPNASWNTNFKTKKVFGSSITFVNGGASYLGSTSGIPLFMSKNSDAFMTGEMCRIAPMLYIMFMLDNYGPLGIHLGMTHCATGKFDPKKIIEKVGGVNNSAAINYYDLLIDGSGDSLDRLCRELPQDLCPTHYNNKQYGIGAGHSVALIGYKFIPNRPDQVLLLMMNSHNFAGIMNRGMFVRRVPLTSLTYGFNGCNPTPARWNEYGLPMKYYYDGSEEVPPGARGGTNEVRGYSAYDWTQTIAYDPSGKSLVTVGDGKNGSHCGIGVHCTSQKTPTKTPYIFRPVLQSKFTNLEQRRVLIEYKKAVKCSDTPKQVPKADAIIQLKTATGISFFVENGSENVDLYLDVKSLIKDVGEGSTTFSIPVSNNDNEVFHDETYQFHMSVGRTLPLCTKWPNTITNLTPNYTAIGSATVCTGGTAKTAKTDKACAALCDADKGCDFFSFHYISGSCKLGCKPQKFDFTKQVCDTVAYKKATDKVVDSPSVEIAEEGVLHLKNRFCKSGQQLYQDIYTMNLKQCTQACKEEKNCTYFSFNGNRCSMYSDCNLGIRDPYEYDFKDLPGMVVPDKGHDTELFLNLKFPNLKSGFEPPPPPPIDEVVTDEPVKDEDPDTPPTIPVFGEVGSGVPTKEETPDYTNLIYTTLVLGIIGLLGITAIIKKDGFSVYTGVLGLIVLVAILLVVLIMYLMSK